MEDRGGVPTLLRRTHQWSGLVRGSERIAHCSARCSVGVWAPSDPQVARSAQSRPPPAGCCLAWSGARRSKSRFAARVSACAGHRDGDVEIGFDSSVTRSAGSVVHEGAGRGVHRWCRSRVASSPAGWGNDLWSVLRRIFRCLVHLGSICDLRTDPAAEAVGAVFGGVRRAPSGGRRDRRREVALWWVRILG